MPGTHDAGGGSWTKEPNADIIASSMLPQGFIMNDSPFSPHLPSAVQQLAISKPISSRRAHCGSESGITRHSLGSTIDMGALPLVPHSPAAVQHSPTLTPALAACAGSAGSGLHTSFGHCIPPISNGVPSGAVRRLRPCASSNVAGSKPVLAICPAAPAAPVPAAGLPALAARSPALPAPEPAMAAASVPAAPTLTTGGGTAGTPAVATGAGIVAGTMVVMIPNRLAGAAAPPAPPIAAVPATAEGGAVATGALTVSVGASDAWFELFNKLQALQNSGSTAEQKVSN